MRGWGAVLCALWCVVACAIIGVRVQAQGAFDTDIQNLLPQTALEPVVRSAIRDAGGAASRRIAILIEGADQSRIDAAAADLQQALTPSGFVPDSAQGEAMGRWLYANRNSLLCETQPSAFNAAATVRRSQAMLYAPLAPISGQMLTQDPFLLTLQLAQCLSPPAGARSAQSALVSGTLAESAFRIDVQDSVVPVIESWRADWPDLTVSRAGAVFYAADGAAQARREIALIGGVSAIAILVLLLGCFRTLRAAIGTLAVTAAGGVGSLAAALLFFPSVHVLVFVFGSALIGVTSDYALHYLATGPQTGWASPEERIRRVARPLAVCALATAFGFASLAFFGVSIFNQVAVFSVAGILTAWWFTMTILPLMDRRIKDGERLSAWWAMLEAPFHRYQFRRWHGVAASLFVIGTIGLATMRFGVLDDVRGFQQRSGQLAAEEAHVREALGFSASPSFLLSYGATADDARRNEEAAMATWSPETARDALALSRFDPSTGRRAENEALIRQELIEPHLAARMEELGLTSVEPYAANPAPLPGMLATLEGDASGVHYLVAPLGEAAARIALADGEGARIVDPAARYSEAFRSFRLLAVGAVAAAFGVCMIIVLSVYRTWRALVVLAAPAIGVVLGVAVPLALGIPASFFSVAALFVVIGAGIDHSVFQFEAEETKDESKELVVFLAALTTILSMGLLGLSGTYPVASFGVVVCAGVTAAYLISFVPLRLGRRG